MNRVENRGVSPVIGVILMVTITILLAAVVGVFAMNMDIPENQPPSTSWDISEEGDAVIVEHDGGESANAGEIVAVVRYNGGSEERLAFTEGTHSYNAGEELTASDSLAIDFSGSPTASDYVDASSHSLTDVEEVQLIWESPGSSQTEPLTAWER